MTELEKYDLNGDGFISLDEMTRYLTSVFRILYEVQPSTRAEHGECVIQQAKPSSTQATTARPSRRIVRNTSMLGGVVRNGARGRVVTGL